MFRLVGATIKSIIRDRVLWSLIAVSGLLVFVPSLSSLSMRQVTELSMSLSLSFVSLIQFVLTVFLGTTVLWKDVERRYTFSILSLPISRSNYIWGRYIGCVIFIFASSMMFVPVVMSVVFIASKIYPPTRQIFWDYIVIQLVFNSVQYSILLAISFFLGSVSTSFFLPVFGTVCVYFVGCNTFDAYRYVNSVSSVDISEAMKVIVGTLYYLVPNFSAFNIKNNVIYSIGLSLENQIFTLIYGVVYSCIVIVAACKFFERREMM